MKNPTIALPLPDPDDFSLDLSKAANAPIIARQSKPQLWLCLYFPDISLETVANKNSDQAQVVIVENAREVLVYRACARALECGITENMSLNAAYALCPELTIHYRDEAKEVLNMASIADWAHGFSSQVSIVSVEKILLEIKGSLRLFSGLSAMLEKMANSFQAQFSFHYQLAVSPVALASQLLCEAGDKIRVKKMADLRPAIANMPLELFLQNDIRTLSKIKKTGVKTVQDIIRLPRDGLARRFGPALLNRLDQLLGDAPDPRSIYEAPLFFKRSIDLPMETSSLKIIHHAANRLFQQLEKMLRQNDMGVVQLSIVLHHLHHSSEMSLRMRQISRAAVQMSALFQEKMERTKLSAPVIEVTVSADNILPFVTTTSSIFLHVPAGENNLSTDPQWENVLEQLQNRLGNDAINYLQVQDEIHPDWAWRYQNTLPVVQPSGTDLRPLWLLQPAKPLALHNNWPVYHGKLKFLKGPERIQTGWWRGDDKRIARDYYIALVENVGYLWVYRDLKKNGRWYLHGFFG